MKITFFAIVVALILSGCKKWIAVDPPITQLSTASVYSGNTSAAGAMTGIYDRMVGNSAGMTDGASSIAIEIALAADEFTNYSTSKIYTQFYKNALSSSNGLSSNYYFWQELYAEIYACNAVLNGLSVSTGVTPSMKRQLTGEAKFMRAFLYFYAVNLYGDVPLTTTTSYLANHQLARTPAPQVYQQIIQDLLDAQSALSDQYVDQAGNAASEKIRPNKGAATALLARAYLYTGEWAKAEAQASQVIGNTANYGLPADLTQVFTANSAEAILQFYPVSAGFNTSTAYYLVLTSRPGTGRFSVALSPGLMNTFEPSDKRLANWVGRFTASGQTWFYPFKYREYRINQPVTEYIMLLRLAEQYLIRAEARAQLGETNATDDLNAIRRRAGLPDYTGPTDKASLLTAILHERRVELFSEWGHRWFDLIRTKNIDPVMGNPGNSCQAKGGTWNTNSQLLPLPFQELQLDPQLKQNPGY